MSSLKKRMGAAAHERMITMRTFEAGEKHVIVEGQLIDDRLTDTYFLSGEKHPAGPIHHFVIRILLRVDDMVIEEIEGEALTVPREVCRETMETLQRIKGLSLTKGYSTKVRGLLGGAEGCSHMVMLLIAMGPAALQGLWSHRARKPIDPRSPEVMKRYERILAVLKNTCYIWREDGPAYTELMERIDKIDKGD